MTEDLPSDEPVDQSTRTGDLKRMADANREATWGDTDAGGTVVPGIISGDLGPKGRVAAQLRSLSRHERRSGEVPRGTAVDGTGRLVLGTMVVIAVVLIGIVVLLGWLLG